jgi:hypothetical protein
VVPQDTERGQAPGGATPEFSLYAREPLMRLVVRLGVTPATLGVAFFVVVAVPLSLAGYSQDNTINTDDRFLTFFENISWSISILYLFPFVVALTLKFYQRVPELFRTLLKDGLDKPIPEPEIDAFLQRIKARADHVIAIIVILLLTAGLNAIYIHETLSNPPNTDWITAGDFMQGLLGTNAGFSVNGACAMVVQIVLSYWILHLAWRGVVLGWGLHQLFNCRDFAVTVVPLHPDRCCGLKAIGDTAMLFNTIMFLLGIYASLKALDKVLIQKASLFSDIGNPVILGSYLIVAPLLFLYPLAAPRQRMTQAKQQFIEPVSRESRRIFQSLSSEIVGRRASAEDYAAIRGALAQARRDIPVWPFDFRSLQALFGTIVVPILPVMVPILVNLLGLGSTASP